MEAIVKMNPDTNKYVVCIYNLEQAPSGYERVILRAMSDEMEENEAVKIADDYNRRAKQCFDTANIESTKHP